MIAGTLRRGEHGDDVKEIQRRLNRAGYRVLIDGDFGRRTQAAVAAFLREQGIAGNGETLDEQAMVLLDTAARNPNARMKFIPPLIAEASAMPDANEGEARGLDTDADHGVDALGVQDEAKAFARVICSRRTGTPLSIGLFGDWGTGKSFFMSQLRDQIGGRCAAYDRVFTRHREREDNAAIEELAKRWHSRVAQVSFNAWHFAEPNLQASLVTQIFDQLADILNPEEPIEDTRARLLSEVAGGKQRGEQAELELHEAEEAVAEARSQRQRRQEELEALREELAVVEAAVAVTSDAEGIEGEAPRTVLKVQGPLPALRIALRWIWSQGKWTRVGIIVGLVLVLVGIVLAALAWWKIINLEPAITIGTTSVGVVTGLVSTILAWWAIVKPNLARAQLAYTAATAGSAALGSFLDQAARDLLKPETSALAVARRRLEEAAIEVDSIHAAIELANEEVARARRSIQELQAGRRFYSFIGDRGESDDYRQHLGLVSMIRKDFAKLEKILRQVEREGPGEGASPPISRIVIHIDDLDRCEPERVVEVLQAVHLLLATPLFVVVLAVDVRWLRRSLSLHYDRLLQYSRTDGEDHDDEARPSPQRYLQKIFQIPFSLRPMGAPGFAALVDHVLRPDFADEPDAPPQTERSVEAEEAKAAAPIDDIDEDELELATDIALALEPAEVEFAKTLHAVIDTPRLAKALINTYRLLRAEIAVVGLEPYLDAEAYRGVLTLLAVQVGRPIEAATLFEALAFTTLLTLGEVILELAKSTSSDRSERRWRALHAAVVDAGTDSLTAAELQPWIVRVRRFSFNPWPSQSF